jgi:hypothetical protein
VAPDGHRRVGAGDHGRDDRHHVAAYTRQAPGMSAFALSDGVVYVEASTSRNPALYERNGFEVVEEYRYADDGPLLWRMWCAPHV